MSVRTRNRRRRIFRRNRAQIMCRCAISSRLPCFQPCRSRVAAAATRCQRRTRTNPAARGPTGCSERKPCPWNKRLDEYAGAAGCDLRLSGLCLRLFSIGPDPCRHRHTLAGTDAGVRTQRQRSGLAGGRLFPGLCHHATAAGHLARPARSAHGDPLFPGSGGTGVHCLLVRHEFSGPAGRSHSLRCRRQRLPDGTADRLPALV